MNEKEIAGASYVIAFYQEVQNLTHNYGEYTNLLLEIEKKYKPENIPAEVNNLLAQHAQFVRLGVMKSYIMFKSIIKVVDPKDKNPPTIEAVYKKIKGDFVINRDDLEEYVMSMNAILVKEVVQNLLATGQDLYKSVYSQ